MRRNFITKKLLVASIGVASVTYAACSTHGGVGGPGVGGAVDPPATDAGNVAPDASATDVGDAARTGAGDA
jgi:hypothetical protein